MLQTMIDDQPALTELMAMPAFNMAGAGCGFSSCTQLSFTSCTQLSFSLNWPTTGRWSDVMTVRLLEGTYTSSTCSPVETSIRRGS